MSTDLKILVLPGAGNRLPDLNFFRLPGGDDSQVEAIHYPGWWHYANGGLSGHDLVAELADRIVSKAGRRPVAIVGLSLGGHLGYAVAAQLHSRGIDVDGFCAIDSFMIQSSAPSAGWKGRALFEVLELVGGGRIAEFGRFLRSRFWRAMLRLADKRLPDLIKRFSDPKWESLCMKIDPILDQELSMRLLLRETAPFVASLDQSPIPLDTPSVLIRTSSTAQDDAPWHRRCPSIAVHQIQGSHHSLFDPENMPLLRNAFLSATEVWVDPSPSAQDHS